LYYLRHLKHQKIVCLDNSFKFGDYIKWELYYKLGHMGNNNEIFIKNNCIYYSRDNEWLHISELYFYKTSLKCTLSLSSIVRVGVYWGY